MKIEELNAAAGSMIDRLKHERADDTTGEAKKLIEALREARQFKLLVDAAAAYNANAAYDPDIAILQAQGLIELREGGDARKLLADTAANVPAGSWQFIETKGLLGRAWKQTFFESEDKSSHQAMEAINNSLTEYKASFDAQPGGSSFAGVNLLALSTLAKREGIPTTVEIEPRPFALKLLTTLDATPINQRDNWYHASRAEAYLGLGDLDAVEMHIGAYVRSEATTSFALGSTLRQFTELWQLDQQGERGHGIVQALRTALLTRENGRLELSPDQIHQSVRAERPSDDQLQKILGAGGVVQYDWLLKGIAKAQSVGVISHAARGREGTGFLVRGGDLIPDLGDELIVMTNAHLISDPPVGSSMPFDEATITFEAVNISSEFTKILWQSDIGALDCTLLRLKEQPTGIKPLEIAKTIPPIPKLVSATRPRVYVIGYPGGRGLAFSLQDNEMLDHEAPPDGMPPDPDVCRVQYRAPTEGGSSGSPVFEASLWRVIALHHAGDKEKMPMLNGKPGTWPANEGIWIQSIVKAAIAANVQV
jgi:V8-like Glu-specific endopeptidase